MKNIIVFIFLMLHNWFYSQEIYANVQVNYDQIGGSNVQVFKTLEKRLKDFINNTNWSGRRLDSFEKIKANFIIIVSERPINNMFKGSIIVQANRPAYGSQYETPLVNINDTNFTFGYTENENLIFNERQFSGKNLIDVISFYIYTILGYDADSFQLHGGKKYFEIAQKIAQNSQSNNYEGWESMGNLKSRTMLINSLLDNQNSLLRNIFYSYHRLGLDNLSGQNKIQARQSIANELIKLKDYENNFQFNIALSLFIETKRNEIFNIFNSNNNGNVNMAELRNIMSVFSPKDIDTKWNKWK